MKRQKKYECNNYLEIEIFNRPKHTRPYERARREKESSSAQKNLNNKKAQRFFVRLVHLNFGPKDLYVDLTYDEENIPMTREEVLRDIRNYISRLKRWRKKQGLSELKYIYVISNTDNNGNKTRYHAHMIINDMDRDVAEGKWNKGYANTERLQFNETGVTGKSLYMARQTKGDRSWGSSTGLKRPEAVVSDKAIKASTAMRMENNPEDRAFFEKLYPGWIFTDCLVERHTDNLMGTSFFIRMRRYDSV